MTRRDPLRPLPCRLRGRAGGRPAGCHRARAERAAAAIAEKNAAARGGLEAWRAVKSMSMSGNLDAGTPRDPVKLAMSYREAASDIEGGGAGVALLHGAGGRGRSRCSSRS